LHPRYLIHAAGPYGRPVLPSIPGIDTAPNVTHSASFTAAGDCAGKSVVVVGTGNSAHDIGRNYALGGATVTVVQRSSTVVISQEMARIFTAAYNESSVSHCRYPCSLKKGKAALERANL
jgi:cation diffusion facilitator CzcD-associated flavoprotein CzcO